MEKDGLFCMDEWPQGCIVAAQVPVMEPSSTFFVRFGNVFSWLCLLAAAAGLGFRPLRERIRRLREHTRKGRGHA